QELTCTTTSVTLDASSSTADGEFTYLWSNGSTDSSILVSDAGDYSVTITGENGCSDKASVEVILIPDTEDPVLSEMLSIEVETDINECGAVITFFAPTATDNCEGTVVTLNEGSLASGSEFPVGTTTVTYTATDLAGNTSTVSFDVIVTDNQDPLIACPANLTQTTEVGESFGIVNFGNATATDNCDVIVEQTAGLPTGSQFPIGVSTVEFTATDASGNTSTCSFTITITDEEPPTILCPANIDMDVDQGICGAVVTFETPIATDNSNFEVTITQTAGPTSGEVFPVGTTTVTFTATDSAGNSASCSFDVTVNDTEDPIFETVADINVNTDVDTCGAVVTFSAPTATDNCEGTVVTLNEGNLVSGSEFPVGTTTVTYTATDVAGNTSSVSFNVIVTDNEDPTITCPSAIITTTESGESYAIVNFEDATATDNCSVTVEQTAGLPSGSQFPIGESTVEFTATDASGNTSTCTVTIIVEDNEPPVIVCPTNIDMNVDAGICGAVVSFEMPSASDNSGLDVTVSQTAGPASGEIFPVGTTTVTFTAIDAAGNAASCSFDVTVNDTEDPIFETVADINVDTDVDVCGAVVTFSAPTATDNCDGTVVTLNEGSLASGSEFPIGTTTVTYTATDAAGNTSTVSFNVIVTDNQDPTIACPVNIITTNTVGQDYAVVNYTEVTAIDNCGVTIERTTGLASGEQFPIGTTVVTHVATDASGNTSVCSFTVFVKGSPIAVDDTASTNEDTSVVIPVLNNDSDPEGDPLTIINTTTPSNGIVVINEDGTITYTPNSDYNGEDSFEYTISDGNGGTDTAIVIITVNPVDDSPPAPPTTSIIQPTCENPTGTITVQTMEGLTYSINGVDYQESGVFSDLAPGTYEVTAQSGDNLTSEITIVTLNEPVAIEIETITAVSQCYDGGTFDLFDLLVGVFDRTGRWENPNSVGSLEGSILDLSSFENDLGTYTFNYIISGSCPSTTEVQLTIDDSCIVLACSLDDIKDSISKAVTPNGDGFNDFFKIGVDLDCGFTFNVKIFNRWGAEIYTMRNYQNNWDGYSDKSFTSSNQLPSGTYYYIIEINGAGSLGPIQGYIYLGTK
ncbi:gliding motility-associated-like protein, partial [Gillisia mitskevichiae]